MNRLIFIKIGGSIITDKFTPKTANIATIKRLALEIKKAQKSQNLSVVISHGSGSFGHVSASKYNTANGLHNQRQLRGLSVVQQDAFEINRIVNQIFVDNNLNVLSFPPSSFCLASNRQIKTIYTDPIIYALKNGSIPIIFGDIIIDTANGCCIFSGEASLDNLLHNFRRKGIKVDLVIQAGNTYGVLDEKGKTIPKITPQNINIYKSAITGSATPTDVTGGMFEKVKQSLSMTKLGTQVYILNGNIKNNLYKAMTGSIPPNSTLICQN